MIICNKLPVYFWSYCDEESLEQIKCCHGLHYTAKDLTNSMRGPIVTILESSLPYNLPPAGLDRGLIGRSETKKEHWRFDQEWAVRNTFIDRALKLGLNTFRRTIRDWYVWGQVFVSQDGSVHKMTDREGISPEFEQYARSIGAYDDRPQKFLDLFDAATASDRGFERALYLLFLHNRRVLLHLNSVDYSGAQFHRDLRQIDVALDGHTDMIFWNLLHASTVFWNVLGKMGKDEDGE